MRFDQLKIRDGLLALLLAFVVIAVGASHRDVVAQRFSAMRAGAPPPMPARTAAPPDIATQPARPSRVIAKLPGGAKLVDQPGASTVMAQLKPGTIVEMAAIHVVGDQTGWIKVRSRSGVEGWAREDDFATEAASAPAIALSDSVAQATGETVSAARPGGLYANTALTERIGGFARGEKIDVLRGRDRGTLVAVSDGVGGRIVGYANSAEVRGVPMKPSQPRARAGSDGPAGDPLAAADDKGAGDVANAALKEAQDQYAGGNFKEAEAKAEEAAALGSSDAWAIVAMSACKQGNTDKALRLAKRLRGSKLAQFMAACPAAEPSPAKTPGDGSAQPTGDAPDGGSP